MKLSNLFRLGRKEKLEGKAVDTGADLLHPRQFFTPERTSSLQETFGRLGIDVTNITNID